MTTEFEHLRAWIPAGAAICPKCLCIQPAMKVTIGGPAPAPESVRYEAAVSIVCPTCRFAFHYRTLLKFERIERPRCSESLRLPSKGA